MPIIFAFIIIFSFETSVSICALIIIAILKIFASIFIIFIFIISHAWICQPFISAEGNIFIFIIFIFYVFIIPCLYHFLSLIFAAIFISIFIIAFFTFSFLFRLDASYIPIIIFAFLNAFILTLPAFSSILGLLS